MNANLSDTLQTCIEILDNGATIDTCLKRFPSQAAELRPLLETAQAARHGGQAAIPSGVYQRGRARVLQAAAEMREQKAAALPFWKRQTSPARSFRLTFASLAVIFFLLTGGTGLVSASSSAIPGDQLYPVKRGWEGFRLSLVFNPTEREHLERSFEKERINEIHELFNQKRLEHVYFQATVESQAADFWVVDGIKLMLDDEAKIDPGIIPGALVNIKGETDDGVLKADEIHLLALPTPTPVSPKPNSSVQGLRLPQPALTTLPTSTPDAAQLAPAETSEPHDTLEPAATEKEKNKDEEETATPTITAQTTHDDNDDDHVNTPTPTHDD